jgi:hypothetical protein
MPIAVHKTHEGKEVVKVVNLFDPLEPTPAIPFVSCFSLPENDSVPYLFYRFVFRDSRT